MDFHGFIYRRVYMKLETEVLDCVVDGKNYDYLLKQTIFMVAGGGQLEDIGTIQGLPLKQCFEKDGVIYHRLSKPLKDKVVTLERDDAHRFLSMQGHSAQHLISAMFLKEYQLETISHHYTQEGSYIDLNTSSAAMIDFSKIETMCNECIRKALPITVSYPDQEQLKTMTLTHEPPKKETIRIVSIEGIEHNPCMGHHVSNTSDIQMMVIDGYDELKTGVRVYYRFGEVIRQKLHTYTNILEEQSVILSKPLEKVNDGLKTKLKQYDTLKQTMANLEDEYAYTLFSQLKVETMNVWFLSIDRSIRQKLLSLLLKETNSAGVIVDGRNIAIYSTAHEAKLIAAKIPEFKGGGTVDLCQGVLTNELTSEKLHEIL